MGVKTIDANMLKNMFLAGAKRIESKKEWINELNVFPVPDGDTGTNMTMTIMSAAREVSALTDPDMESLSKGNFPGSVKRRQRQFRCYSVPVIPWFYTPDQRRESYR